MNQSQDNRWLHRFAVLTALATLALIGIGGLVTSHEAGMSVPDWPTSYGYNPFLLPLSRWWHVGNVFYEHSHRLFASGVGLLTTILMVWLWIKEPRRWLKWLGVVAFLAVVLQAVLGGLRVILFKDQIGIFHGTLAQLFFVLTCAIAMFTSSWWGRNENVQSPKSKVQSVNPGPLLTLQRLLLVTTVLILFQLVLGATMRHQHAGLAISDFPLAHGRLWPATDAASVARYNEQRIEITDVNPITAFQIQLQMVHRVAALLILVAVAFCGWRARHTRVARFSIFWLGLIIVQASLGAATVLKDKAADVATAHVLVGALSLATGAILSIVAVRLPQFVVDPSLVVDLNRENEAGAVGEMSAAHRA
jgi:cytochrome c oxidase assembly protein subunit 15